MKAIKQIFLSVVAVLAAATGAQAQLTVSFGSASQSTVPLVQPHKQASIFLTGHDSDTHAGHGGNAVGAQHVIQSAIQFVTDPLFNPFAASGVGKFLFVESQIPTPPGHGAGVLGIIDSGYQPGEDFDLHDASTLLEALSALGTEYSALVVASDFGGLLTQAEQDILNEHAEEIIGFLNSGGGLFALAESNDGAHLTPNGGLFGFLPFVASNAALNQFESGNSLTPFGASLGLTSSDINGNFSHNMFLNNSGLNVVDVDSAGRIISLAGRGRVTDMGVVPVPITVVPEPSTMGLLLSCLLPALREARRRRAPARRTATC